MSYEPAPGMPTEGHGAPGPTAAKPGSVALAEKLMYGGAAITLVSGLLSLFVDRDGLRETLRNQLEAAGQATDEASLDAAMQFGMISGIVAAVVGAALWALMGWLNGKGIGWARIVATILGVLGVLVTLVGLFGTALVPGGAAGGTLSMVLSVVTGALALAVVVLLWRPDASAFFAARARR
ncbi:hypothetical protein [Ornithinimicrobium pratense]|uniref:Uncharacterized protein n=1 Tax=Ornithinimicrobium pratense TaxID=2593973 RepID=A0A5J6V4E5_9MICO|nr:hypothetical protein [Ornithinimicrobium pratense]QFG67863.1 hypothetical protein FY030_03195 [Ornithinimicrobium pratense]